MTGGMISAPSREVTIDKYVMNLIQVDAAINPGNSGGPLVNSQGQVVGVVNAKIMTSNSNDVEGIGFAIPIETALSVANDLIEYGYVTNRPTLGVSVQSLSQQEAMLYRLEPGVTVVEVTPGGGAEKAGVQVGDKIVAFNGVEVESFSELNYEKDKCEPGDTVTLTVERDGSPPGSAGCARFFFRQLNGRKQRLAFAPPVPPSRGRGAFSVPFAPCRAAEKCS